MLIDFPDQTVVYFEQFIKDTDAFKNSLASDFTSRTFAKSRSTVSNHAARSTTPFPIRNVHNTF